MENNNEQWLDRLIRKDLRSISIYQSARRQASTGEVWINANESSFNNATSEYSELASINRYPEPQPTELINRYAAYSGVKLEQILCCRGADEGIELLIRTFCQPNIDAIAYLAPSYGMYQISASANGVEALAIDFKQGFTLPSSINLPLNCKILFVCNPNNPTGTLISPEEILSLAVNNPMSLIVVDEAYIEFCLDQSCVPLIQLRPNIVVLRTLSKAFALAGARCGFVLAREEIIQQLSKIIAPYPLPTPSVQLATNALSDDGIELMRSQVEEINTVKKRFESELKQYGSILISFTNFVFAFFEDANKVWNTLISRGIIARRFDDKKLKNGIRFTVSDLTTNSLVIDALREVK